MILHGLAVGLAFLVFLWERHNWVGLGKLVSTKAGRDDSYMAKGEGPTTVLQ